jgi:hypothetical protein
MNRIAHRMAVTGVVIAIAAGGAAGCGTVDQATRAADHAVNQGKRELNKLKRDAKKTGHQARHEVNKATKN